MEDNSDNDINQVLSEITGALVGQFNLVDLLDRIVILAMSLLKAEVCSIFLEDKEKHPNIIKMMAGSGFAKVLVGQAEYRIGEGFTGFIAQTGRKFNIKTQEELQNLINEETRETIWKGKHDGQQWQSSDQGRSGENKFRNLVALPLTIKDQIFGVIKVENKREEFGDFFSAEDERNFEIIANVVALAIENARLHNKIETQLKAISAKAAHRINNQAANYDGIELDIKDELKNQIPNKENLSEICERLVDTTKNLKKMIREFKNYGKPFVLKRTNCSINKIITDEAWYARPPNKIRIERDLDKTIPDVLLDEGRFAESIKELISNSMKAILKTNREDGLIKITTTKLSDNSRGEEIIVKIEDNGTDFPPNFHVFEPFNSTDPQSTGLGLATVKELIEMHGGSIWADKSLYDGACIIFTIPISK